MVVRGPGEIKISAANVVDGLIVDEKGAVGVFDGAMGGEDGVIRLDDGRVDTRGGIDGKLELCLLAVLGSQAFKEEGSEAGAGAAAKGIENQEALEGMAVVCAFMSGGQGKRAGED